VVLCIDGKKLYRWYKEVLSGFSEAGTKKHLHQYDIKEKDKNGKEHIVYVPLLKEENIGQYMSIDEKHIGDHVYTILSNRSTGKIAMIASTLKVKSLVSIMSNFGETKFKVKSIARDLSESFNWLCRQSFMNATHVADKFHVLTHLFDASQDIRVYHRQKILSQRRKQFEDFKQQEFDRAGQCMNQKKIFVPKEFSYKEPRYSNGETARELLARSRYLLYKFPDQWTDAQAERADVLFEKYPDIKTVYELSCEFRKWYSQKNIGKNKEYLLSELHRWYFQVDKTAIEEILNFKSLVEKNQPQILNYFDKGESNAMAEAINSKIQQFIHSNKGVKDKDFFFFRLSNYFS
jgi:transposase